MLHNEKQAEIKKEDETKRQQELEKHKVGLEHLSDSFSGTILSEIKLCEFKYKICLCYCRMPM